MAERIVVDTGPLVAAARAGLLELLGRMPYEFVCPPEVREELENGIPLGHAVVSAGWLQVMPL